MSAKSFALNSGERQVATTYGDVNANHRARYEWANDELPIGGRGLDIFCGVGYGAWLLSCVRQVEGIDGSAEAIAVAREHYNRPGKTTYSAEQWPVLLPAAHYDFVTALESIEHIEDGRAFFASCVKALRRGGHFIFSTPCEDVRPHDPVQHPFHVKHYSFSEITGLVEQFRLDVVNWGGQDTHLLQNGRAVGRLAEAQQQVRQHELGQCLIFHCLKP